MNHSDHSSPPTGDPAATAPFATGDAAAELVQVLDVYLEDLQAGRNPDRARVLSEHPHLAAQLEQCLAGIEFIHETTRCSAEAPQQLGDFRILREIGRGGMGVVYEAEQISLRRRVALKVLRFGAVADKDAMERFRREAETVACLHHTNIVPIFAVGSEGGVHYYAMQFIEGRSLADVLQADRGLPADAQEVARWGLQAAEALAHAHERGVIHRDIKPSNLLLDPDGRIWLTDFGLARRADEVTMTLSGVLMGTPRYMSPEQASAIRHPVDHRTDLYSLGATLYELATGKPVFEAETPQGVITQIMHADPIAPRHWQRSLPRDLETIILKCLAKNPARRYGSAQALADDLRLFLLGRPIAARRANVAERTLHWARKQRRSTTVAAVSLAAALLLIAGALTGWNAYAQWQLASLHLGFNNRQLNAHATVLNEQREPVTEFAVPHHQAVSIPASDYRVQLAPPGMLGETFDLSLQRGERAGFWLEPLERRLWGPLPVSPDMERVQLDGAIDFLLRSEQTLRRVDGATSGEVWQVNLHPDSQRSVRNDQDYDRSWQQFFELDPFASEGASVVRPLVDLDRDGAEDIIWSSRRFPALLALSGKDGHVLWFHLARPVLPDDQDPAELSDRHQVSVGHSMVGQPLRADVDGDGSDDLIATFASAGEFLHPRGGTAIMTGPQWWAEAISARTGQLLWKRLLKQVPSKEPARQLPSQAAALVTREGRELAVIAVGSVLATLDVKTGEIQGPLHDLASPLAGQPQLVDTDGDEQVDLLLTRLDQVVSVDLGAIQLADAQVAWKTTLEVGEFERRGEPIVDDLDGDGQPEVILLRRDAGRRDRAEVEILHAANGQTMWRREMKSGALPLDRLIVGPDCDGDRTREIYLVMIGRLQGDDLSDQYLTVDALSGANGRTLWWWHEPEKLNLHFRGTLDALRWWQAGPDGYPLLLVAYGSHEMPDKKSRVFALSASTGELEYVLSDYHEPATGDLDGDGIVDLWAVQRDGPSAFAGIQASAWRGAPPEAWRNLGSRGKPAQDYDGDGRTDLISHERNLTAVSGSTGRVLWRSAGEGELRLTPSLPEGDLDGDGTADVLQCDSRAGRVRAVSGRTGRVLWSHRLQLESGKRVENINSGLPYWGCHRFEASRDPDVLIAYRTTDAMRQSSGPVELVRISGRDGQAIWTHSLNGSQSIERGQARLRMALADLNRDGIADPVFWTPDPTARTLPGSAQLRLVAIDGSEGNLLWQRPAGIPSQAEFAARHQDDFPAPTVGDLDRDGESEVMIRNYQQQPASPGVAFPVHVWQVMVLNGSDGQPRWTWDGDVESLITQESRWINCAPRLIEVDGTAAIAVSTLVRRQDNRGESQPFSLEGQYAARLVLLDAQGQVHDSRELPDAWRVPLWSHDLDGDGSSELALISERRLQALRGGIQTEHLLWQHPLEDDRVPALPVYVPGPGAPATVIVRHDKRVEGLAGSTGKSLWRCEDAGRDPAEWLWPTDPEGLPWLIFNGPSPAHPTAQYCRQALPVSEDGMYAAPPALPVAMAAVDDPRWLRPLPWVSHSSDNLPVILVAAVAALALLAFGALATRNSWREGHRGMALLRGAALIGLAVLVYPSLFALPLGAFLWQLSRATLARRWTHVGLMIAGSIVVGIGIGALWLWFDSQALVQGERYAWRGSYYAWPMGAYAVGALMLLALLAARIIACTGERLASLLGRPQSLPSSP